MNDISKVIVSESYVKFSFHTGGLEWLTFEEVINKLADIGYDACGPIVGPGCHLDPDTITESQKAAYKKLANDRNIAFSILNPWKVGGFAAGVASGETERFYHKALDLAADLGIPAVKFLSGTFLGGRKNVSWRAIIKILKSLCLSKTFTGSENPGWRAMIRVLKPLCHHANQVGVDILMHNREDELVDTANAFALLRYHVGSDRLKINLDCANLAILMDDPCQAIHEFKEYLSYVRIKGMNNYYPFARQCVPGAPGDIVNWEAVIRALKEVGYTGFVEMVPYPWFPPDFHERAFEWATALEAKVDLQ